MCVFLSPCLDVQLYHLGYSQCVWWLHISIAFPYESGPQRYSFYCYYYHHYYLHSKCCCCCCFLVANTSIICLLLCDMFVHFIHGFRHICICDRDRTIALTLLLETFFVSLFSFGLLRTENSIGIFAKGRMFVCLYACVWMK